MGVYDGAQICEFVGFLLLNNLNRIIDCCNHGLYQDNRLIILDNPRKGDVIWEKCIGDLTSLDLN